MTEPLPGMRPDRSDVPPDRFPFWDWSLRTYAREGVAAACLALQDRHGLDVNLLLFGLWMATERRPLGSHVTGAVQTLDRVAADAGRWHVDVVRPLRAARRAIMRPGDGADPVTAALRDRVKAAELEAERIEQWMLFRAARSVARDEGAGAARPADLARRHLDALRVAAQVDWDEADQAAARVLLAAIDADGSSPETDALAIR